jgi:large subunit ribosomal protein L28
MVATKRRFDPNLQKVRIEVNGAPRREYVCTRCLKAGKVRKYVPGPSVLPGAQPQGQAEA